MNELLIKYEKSLKRLNKLKVNYQFHFECAVKEKDEIKCKMKIECVDKRIFLVELFIKDLKNLQGND